MHFLSTTPKRVALLALLIGIFASVPDLRAQRASGDVGIGPVFGVPSGLSVRIMRPRHKSWEFFGAWDLKDFYFGSIHRLWEWEVRESAGTQLYAGPGVFAGVEQSPDPAERDQYVYGASFQLGLAFVIRRTEFFIQMTPNGTIRPEIEAGLGLGAGVRIYLHTLN